MSQYIFVRQRASHIPTLVDMCVDVVANNLQDLSVIGNGVPEFLVLKMLARATPVDLARIHSANEEYDLNLDSLWQAHCEKKYKATEAELITYGVETYKELFEILEEQQQEKIQDMAERLKQKYNQITSAKKQRCIAVLDTKSAPPLKSRSGFSSMRMDSRGFRAPRGQFDSNTSSKKNLMAKSIAQFQKSRSLIPSRADVQLSGRVISMTIPTQRAMPTRALNNKSSTTTTTTTTANNHTQASSAKTTRTSVFTPKPSNTSNQPLSQSRLTGPPVVNSSPLGKRKLGDTNLTGRTEPPTKIPRVSVTTPTPTPKRTLTSTPRSTPTPTPKPTPTSRYTPTSKINSDPIVKSYVPSQDAARDSDIFKGKTMRQAQPVRVSRQKGGPANQL